jgi:16S rRNA (uracil1498-N3)-methyltransferase
LVGSLQPDAKHPREYLRQVSRANSAAVWIGPEGDFTQAELEAIKSSGARPITLGPLVLRMETAAIYCLSILNYELTGDTKQ